MIEEVLRIAKDILNHPGGTYNPTEFMLAEAIVELTTENEKIKKSEMKICNQLMAIVEDIHLK